MSSKINSHPHKETHLQSEKWERKIYDNNVFGWKKKDGDIVLNADFRFSKNKVKILIGNEETNNEKQIDYRFNRGKIVDQNCDLNERLFVEENGYNLRDIHRIVHEAILKETGSLDILRKNRIE